MAVSNPARCATLAVVAWGCAASLAQAQIIGSPPLTNCPFPGVRYACVIDGQATVNGVVGNFEQVRIARNGLAGLTIGSGASLVLNSNIIPNADLTVGDNFSGFGGTLLVRDGGALTINAPIPGNLYRGLGVGVLAGPGSFATVKDGGSINVNLPGGPNVGAAVAVGRDPGANGSILLDGGIGNFGSAALGATLNTTGNLSIGRQGTGSVALTRNANLSANQINMSVIDGQGVSALFVGFQSTVNAAVVNAGIGYNALGLGDPTVAAHGTASVVVQHATSTLNSTLLLGTGGSLRGAGRVSQLFNYGGLVAPGNSPGTLTIGSGGYTDVAGRLQIEVGNSGRDKLLVEGPVSMHGTTVDFSFIEGFAPSAGFSFDFLDSTEAAIDVQNLNFNFTGLAPGFLFSVQPGSDGRLVFTALNQGISVPEPVTLVLLVTALLAGAAGSSGRRVFRTLARH